MADTPVSPLREPPVRSVDDVADSTVVRLAGELDLYNAPEVRDALRDALARAPARLVLDMSEVEFVDSTALGVLVETSTRSGASAVLLAAPRLEVRRTLQVSGLDRRLRVHDTVESALAG